MDFLSSEIVGFLLLRIITIPPDGSNGIFIDVKSPRVSAKGLDQFFNGSKYNADMMLIAAQKC